MRDHPMSLIGTRTRIKKSILGFNYYVKDEMLGDTTRFVCQ